MTDLERFFRQIAHNLAATDPGRLQQPLRVAEIRHTVLPYRANRRALQLESSEDYELMLMRLCAGEGGFAHTDPENVQAEFAAEIASPNPDLTMIDRHENALVTLEARSVSRALDPTPDQAFAPPAEAGETRRNQGQAAAPEQPPVHPAKLAAASGRPEVKADCPRCGRRLPTGRVVNFCPECGQNLTAARCPECKTELEPEWRHCVGCGLPLTGR